MTFPITGKTKLTQNLPGNYINVNDFGDANELINHGVKEIEASAGGTITVSGDDNNAGFMFKLTGAPGSAVTVKFPDGDRNRAIWNECGQSATIDTVTGSTSTVSVADTAQKQLQFSGTEIISELTLTKV